MATTAHPTSNAPLYAVTLIDRRTGKSHSVGGTPLTALSRDPHGAAAEMLAGRNPLIWQARIQSLPETPTRKSPVTERPS